jgi:hypothetical protein
VLEPLNLISRTEDPTLLRTILNTDRHWAVYALGDLDPPRWPYCEWFHSDSAVVLLYRAPARPVLFALGPPEAIGALLIEAARHQKSRSISGPRFCRSSSGITRAYGPNPFYAWRSASLCWRTAVSPGL